MFVVHLLVGVFLSGFSSSSENSGVHQLADDPEVSQNIPGDKVKILYREQAEGKNAITQALRDNPNESVIIIGHSFGGDSAIELANALGDMNICVDLLIQIDTVGANDETLPDNVKKGVNIWATGTDFPNGASHVEGSENIAIDNTTHTAIDDNPANNPNVGSSSDLGYEGMNAWDLVKHFTGQLPNIGCNGTVQISMLDLFNSLRRLEERINQLWRFVLTR